MAYMCDLTATRGQGWTVIEIPSTRTVFHLPSPQASGTTRRWPPGRDWGPDVRRHGLERELNTYHVRVPGSIHHAGARAEAARRRRRGLHRELPQQCRPPAPSLCTIDAEGAVTSARRPLTRRRGERGRPPREDRGRGGASGRIGCHGLACWER